MVLRNTFTLAAMSFAPPEDGPPAYLDGEVDVAMNGNGAVLGDVEQEDEEGEGDEVRPKGLSDDSSEEEEEDEEAVRQVREGFIVDEDEDEEEEEADDDEEERRKRKKRRKHKHRRRERYSFENTAVNSPESCSMIRRSRRRFGR